MIAYVTGELAEAGRDFIVLDVGNMGIRIRVSEGVLSALPAFGARMKVHTYTYVKEDAFLLYGFLTKDDLELFQMMITVNGIGPKAALAILSVMSGNDLRFAIYTGDAKAISKANGVGAKTAERLILDLKDKMNMETVLENSIGKESDSADGGLDQERRDAMDALVALGYGMTEAAHAVRQVDMAANPDADAILKASLRFLL